MSPRTLPLVTLAACLVACAKPSEPVPTTPAPAATAQAASPSGSAHAAAPSGNPLVGKPAPDFTLTDLDGEPFKLSEQRGKIVVLEWFNPDCPFVKLNHEKGSLQGMARREMDKGTVWVSVNSGKPGKQGTGAERNVKAKADYAMPNRILLDESGAVGKLYDAKHTPHMMVIDKEGTLVYRGAIDNAPDGEPMEGREVINYVAAALDDVRAGRPVSTAQPEAYGCSVKY